MDAFTSITAYFTTAPSKKPAPVEEEHGGSASNVYCVVTKLEETSGAPVVKEHGGAGSNVYCVVA
ncbi:hypothetical protein VKT23_002776 [Stygiomarasmius scandens]|uniref:Pheromone n=1 Tax=Marasmiellus scandens TaxID=2682957 RepID=A0ABR1JY08_9AGAR